MKRSLPLLLLVALLFVKCTNEDTNNGNENNEDRSNVTRLSYTVVAAFPHDTSAFTQGLEFYNGQLLEGTGLEKKSRLIRRNLNDANALQSVFIDSSLFGEGITVLNDTLFQLTWQNQKVLVYTAKDFKKIKEFPLTTEGWGITNNGKELIVTDGSSNIYFYEPSTFRLLRTQGVTEDGSPTIALNELEYIKGFIYANQYQYPYIVKIDPSNGLVVGKLDFTEVVQRTKAKYPQADFLNGIAFNPQTNKVYITGKLWPEIYEVNFPF
jgi:glutamine cyclotransferase